MHDELRGEVLLEGGRRFSARPGLLSGLFARLFAPAVDPLLARIDKGLAAGSLSATLPDGSTRDFGGRGEGFSAQVHLHNWRGLLRVATGGSIGLYEGWAAGEWSSPDPVAFFALFVANAGQLGDAARAKGPARWGARFMHWLKRNTRSQAEKNIHAHYDLGNDFYGAWLDPSMTYSSAYGLGEAGLETAQHAKWARLSQRLGTPEKLLEIGCGWGSLADHFAQNGAQTTAISLSEEQLAWARERYAGVEFLKCDYRDMDGRFDAIVSVEMVEALGRNYWPTFMDCVERNLKPGGRAAIQYIAMDDEFFDAYAASADFIQAYVFPGGMLIRSSEFKRLAEERGLSWQDQDNFGLDYAETLRIWREHFEAAAQEGRLPDGFDKRFIDLWRFYLMYCEGGFRGGTITVSQVTLVKENT